MMRRQKKKLSIIIFRLREKIRQYFHILDEKIFFLKHFFEKLEKIFYSLKRDDLAAHHEVNKCLKISPLFQTIFALSFGHYIE